MEPELAAFLDGLRPAAVERVVWAAGRIRLDLATYLGPDLPPLEYVSSVRALVLRGDEVLVVRDPDGAHVLPGGRREPGETLTQTVHREVAEETGWRVELGREPLGFAHFRHRTPRPPDHRYPYPDFAHAVYAARAADFDASRLDPERYELEARFRPAAGLASVGLTRGERALLRAALDAAP